MRFIGLCDRAKHEKLFQFLGGQVYMDVLAERILVSHSLPRVVEGNITLGQRLNRSQYASSARPSKPNRYSLVRASYGGWLPPTSMQCCCSFVYIMHCSFFVRTFEPATQDNLLNLKGLFWGLEPRRAGTLWKVVRALCRERRGETGFYFVLVSSCRMKEEKHRSSP